MNLYEVKIEYGDCEVIGRVTPTSLKSVKNVTATMVEENVKFNVIQMRKSK